MRILKTDRLYCFSPPVMIATFIIEVAFAAYVLFRYKLTPVSRVVVALLVGLATFQFAEYNVCEGAWGLDSLSWARIGYVAITFLPPLGIHLVTKLSGKKNPLLVAAAYVTGAIFAFIFLFVGQGMLGEQCLGNYVIFKIAPWAVWPYALYYYGWMLVGAGYAIWLGQKAKKNIRAALYSLAVGYMAFIIPTTTVNILDPSTIAGIPSIMCGFAVILALILTLKVMPEYSRKDSKRA
jgi:hypothetical protein